MMRVFWSIILTLSLAMPAEAAEPAPVVPPVPPKPSAGITLPKSLEVIVGRARGNVLAADTAGKSVKFTVGYGVDTPDLLQRDATSTYVICPSVGWYYIFAATVVDGEPVISDGCLVHAVAVPTPPAPPPEPPKPPTPPTPPVPQPPTPGPGPSPIPPIPQPPAPPVPPTPPVPPKPPEPPAPSDPFTQSVQNAWKLETATDREQSRKSLAALYRQAGSNTAHDASVKTIGDLFGIMSTAAKSLGVTGKLPQLQVALAVDLKASLPSSATAPLDDATRQKVSTEFEKIAKALDSLGG